VEPSDAPEPGVDPLNEPVEAPEAGYITEPLEPQEPDLAPQAEEGEEGEKPVEETEGKEQDPTEDHDIQARRGM
jgi:hypothetical protein